MAYKDKVRKEGSGSVTESGAAWAKAGGFSNEWAKGLTDADVAGLIVIADNTDQVIEAMGLAIARALEAIGIEAESDAADICPVDTGRLRNSITHTIDEGEQVAIIGTNVEYAQYVHNGTSTHAAQPFLTDAVTRNQKKYRSIAEAALKGA